MSKREIDKGSDTIYRAVRASEFPIGTEGNIYIQPSENGTVNLSNESTISIDLNLYDIISQDEENNKLIIKVKRKAE